jgi:hypothetical protein
MRALVVAVITLLSTAGLTDDDDVARAKEAEEKAFAAIDAQRYCDALHLFLDADALAPSPDLVANAALAANLAGDRVRALALYATVIKRYDDEPSREKVRRQMATITDKMAAEGPGAACPSPAATTTTEPKTKPDPVAPPIVDQTPAAPTPAPVAPSPAASSSPWPWAFVAGGAALAVAGGLGALLGASPWVDYNRAAERIDDAEAADELTAAEGFQQDLARAKSDWEGWGLPLMSVSGAGTLAGLGLVGVGVALLATEGP